MNRNPALSTCAKGSTTNGKISLRGHSRNTLLSKSHLKKTFSAIYLYSTDQRKTVWVVDTRIGNKSLNIFWKLRHEPSAQFVALINLSTSKFAYGSYEWFVYRDEIVSPKECTRIVFLSLRNYVERFTMRASFDVRNVMLLWSFWHIQIRCYSHFYNQRVLKKRSNRCQ